MKRILCFFSAVMLLFLSPGCSTRESNKYCDFYYPRATYTYNSKNSVIACEKRSTEDYLAVSKILQYYLQGPEDITLTNPFPSGLTLILVQLDGHVLNVVLSDHLSELAEVPLIIACTSLARTAMGITTATSVRISCYSTLINGKNSILIDNNTVLLEDIGADPAESTQ